MGALAVMLAATAQATANYVYHEETAALTGGSCGAFRDPLSPGPSETVTVRTKIEYQFYTDEARLYYTTDGSMPSGALGGGDGSTQVVSAAFNCTFDFGSIIDVVEAVLPQQPVGTTVRYVVGAWHSGGGPEVFANSGTCDSCGAACTNAGCADVFAYTVFGSGLDAGAVDAARPDTALPDSSVADTAQADAAQADAAVLDAAEADAAEADAAGPDAAAPDAAAVDAAEADAAEADAAGPDAATPDATEADAARADAGGADSAVVCVPGCQGDSQRVVCGGDGEPIFVPCSAGTTCRDGRCVSSSEPAPEPEEEGCGCSLLHQSPAFFGMMSCFLLGHILRRIGRRRRLR